MLWAVAADARERTFEDDPDQSADDIYARQDTANLLGGLTVGVGSAAALTGVSAFVFARW